MLFAVWSTEHAVACVPTAAKRPSSDSRSEQDTSRTSGSVGGQGQQRPWSTRPFYGAAALCVLANALVAANWFLLLAGGTLLVLLVIRTRKEEEKLIERFGDSYRRYMAETGRFLP